MFQVHTIVTERSTNRIQLKHNSNHSSGREQNRLQIVSQTVEEIKLITVNNTYWMFERFDPLHRLITFSENQKLNLLPFVGG